MARQTWIRWFGLGAAALLFAGQAWAVVGEVAFKVTSPTGDPVPGATINIGDATATTGADGTASVNVLEGEVVAVIEDEDHVIRRVPVVVVPGKTTQVGVVLDPLRPWMGQNPGGGLGNIAVGGQYQIGSLDNMHFTTARDVFIDTIGGTPQPPVVMEQDLEAYNGAFDPNLDIDIAAADLAIGLPRTADHGTRLYPSLIVTLGRASADLDFHNNAAPGASNMYDGSGTVYGLGFNGVIVPGDRTAWYTQFGLDYSMLDTIDVDRDPPLAGADRDDVTLDYDSLTAQVSAGYSFHYASVYAGARYVNKQAELEGEVFADFGGGDTTTIDFVNKFESDTVEAIAGVDLRIPGTRLFARLEAASGSDTSSVTGMLVYGFGFAPHKQRGN